MGSVCLCWCWHGGGWDGGGEGGGGCGETKEGETERKGRKKVKWRKRSGGKKKKMHSVSKEFHEVEFKCESEKKKNY